MATLITARDPESKELVLSRVVHKDKIVPIQKELMVLEVKSMGLVASNENPIMSVDSDWDAYGIVA